MSVKPILAEKFELKLAEVPVETQDALNRKSELGVRLTNVLKRINFPDRDKMVLSLDRGYSQFGDSGFILRMRIEVTHTRDGGPTALEHSVNINNEMSDKQLAAQVFILTTQFWVHEFMENFRYEGEILFDPHGTHSHREIFEAIRNVPNQKPLQMFHPIEFTITMFDTETTKKNDKLAKLAKKMDKSLKDAEKEKKKKPEPMWHKFNPPEPWRTKGKRAA